MNSLVISGGGVGYCWQGGDEDVFVGVALSNSRIFSREDLVSACFVFLHSLVLHYLSFFKDPDFLKTHGFGVLNRFLCSCQPVSFM